MQPPRQTNSEKCNKISRDVLFPPAKIATPAFGIDVAASPYRGWLITAVLQDPLFTLKISTTLENGLAATQSIRHAHTINTPQYPNRCNPLAKHIQQQLEHMSMDVQDRPPAKIATPALGSDVAASSTLAWLRIAVLQFPVATLKMSTTLDAPDSTAQVMRNAHVIKTPYSPHSCNPLAKPIQKNAIKYHGDVLFPPAKIATPALGSDVAASPHRPWLSNAVLEVPS
jgi:hypothetical protein